MTRILDLARGLLGWIMRPPDFGALEWSNECHYPLDEDDA